VPIRDTCACGQEFRLPRHLAGRRATCPGGRVSFTIPVPPPAPTVTPELLGRARELCRQIGLDLPEGEAGRFLARAEVLDAVAYPGEPIDMAEPLPERSREFFALLARHRRAFEVTGDPSGQYIFAPDGMVIEPPAPPPPGDDGPARPPGGHPITFTPCNPERTHLEPVTGGGFGCTPAAHQGQATRPPCTGMGRRS